MSIKIDQTRFAMCARVIGDAAYEKNLLNRSTSRSWLAIAWIIYGQRLGVNRHD
jgi:hypothetical protein